MRSLEEFNNKHIGHPAFIIGAGTSVALENLECLRDKITIAVNSGYLAVKDFATYFISDDWSIANYDFFYNDLKQSNTTMLLYEDKLKHTASWFGDRSVLFRHRKGIHIPKEYRHDNSKYYLGETRTSLGSGIMSAVIMGCNPIILLGLDGCRNEKGHRYFWQIPPFIPPKRNDGIPLDLFRKCKLKGKKTDTDLIDIAKTWDAFGKEVLKLVDVCNCSPLSVLNIFPKRDLKEFVWLAH